MNKYMIIKGHGRVPDIIITKEESDLSMKALYDLEAEGISNPTFEQYEKKLHELKGVA